MKEKFDYAELKDICETFARDNESMALRIEVIKEICELPEVNIDWSKLDIKILRYYAEEPQNIPRDSWMFKRTLKADFNISVLPTFAE